MSQDEKEISEIARSIASLFGAEGELETSATEQSGGATERHPDVGVSLGLEDALDANAEPGLVDPVALPVEPASIEAEETPAEPEPELSAPEPEPSAPEPEPSAPEPESTAPVPEPSAPEPEPSETGRALSEATSQYLQAPIQEREGAQRQLRAAVEASRSADAVDEIAASVNVLLVQGAGDADAEGLAGELMDEDVLAVMVAQLGRVRDVEEREGLIGAFMKLGDPVANAITAALTDTEDRLARKTYLAALGALGSSGARAAEGMLRDSRWFVVRNGVAVIGMVGGPSAIEPLTGSLGHDHPGVRRETVQSLAKIGGENAGLLVSSMLGDSDPRVRAAAARAVSALKVERAYKQLVGILDKGDEEAVIEEVLRALGALGDASAVPAITKRMKGSLFRRPSKGVRLAGLAALAAIGTPHAVSLVKKARADKDPEIGSAAAQLLRRK